MYILLAEVTPRKISSATVTIKCITQYFFFYFFLSFIFPAWSHRYLFRVSSGTLIFQLEEQAFFPRTDRQQTEWNKFTDIMEARENSPSLTPTHEDMAVSGSRRPTFQFPMPTFQFHLHSNFKCLHSSSRCPHSSSIDSNFISRRLHSSFKGLHSSSRCPVF